MHPTLQEHFRSVPHDDLLSDPRVPELRVAQGAMNAVITAVLDNAGFRTGPAQGERAGEILVGESPG